jgi:uncharacterized protein (DUF2225 family)
VEMIRDALSPERLEQMRRLLENEHKDPTALASELGDNMKRKREEEQERREREKWEKKRRNLAGVR